ncbi:hypothetical protein HPP92_007338 [Vanilla planifolia]|uniref:Uncharacterized protein n=1 Tax=Vanilla planifolia TaxID=51239 RepID=A0A835V7Q3_VANPL|nr:hypothetical protein HPP92_007338 [Vanilla planifolia]
MAAASPVPGSKAGDPSSVAVNGNLRSITLDAPKQNLRGLNKPKCSKCGNVARSRCPFQSCKSCCAKAQNPCPIHVLKQSGTLPDKPPPSTIPLLEQQCTDATSSGASWRLTSLRQLSTAFANSFRVRKPLTRKDAININKWRFSKLREYIEGNIEVENEAFERYLLNVSLLEEAFSTTGEITQDEQLTTLEGNIQKLVASMKVKLKSNPTREAIVKERMRKLVHEKLRKLHERGHELFGEASVSADDESVPYRDPKRVKLEEWAEKNKRADDLIDKLSKARNKDDLESCSELRLQLFSNSWGKDNAANGKDTKFGAVVEDETVSIRSLSFSLPKLCTVVNSDVLTDIVAQVSSGARLAEL